MRAAYADACGLLTSRRQERGIPSALYRVGYESHEVRFVVHSEEMTGSAAEGPAFPVVATPAIVRRPVLFVHSDIRVRYPRETAVPFAEQSAHIAGTNKRGNWVICCAVDQAVSMNQRRILFKPHTVDWLTLVESVSMGAASIPNVGMIEELHEWMLRITRIGLQSSA